MRVDERWPELFEGLTEAQHESVVHAVAISSSENWQPVYEHVKLLCDHAAGRVGEAEYRQRTIAVVRHRVESQRSAGVLDEGGERQP